MLYLSILGLLIYNQQIRKNELDKIVSSVAKATLLEYYKPWEYLGEEQLQRKENQARVQLEEEIRRRCETNTERKIEIKMLDLEKGLVSVKVEETYHLPGGKNKQLQLQKTILMDKPEENENWVQVSFWEGGNCLKEYQAKEGEELPVPQVRGHHILTWRNANSGEIYQNQDKVKVGKDNVRICAVGVGK